MKGWRMLWQELLSLFVDDEQMALFVVLWLGVLAILRAAGVMPPRVLALVLFAGLVVILVRSIWQKVVRK